MRKVLVLLAFTGALCVSCEKNKEEEVRYSGEIVLSSERLQSATGWDFYGFSFETGKISIYTITSSIFPDLAVEDVELQDSVNIDLRSSNDLDAFYKNNTFPTAAEAESYFKGYQEVTATDFVPIAYNIKANQIWTVQTLSKRFAKIWIKNITVETGGQSEYANVTFEYSYQPDGSKTFE
jgi:hypothetical protein